MRQENIISYRHKITVYKLLWSCDCLPGILIMHYDVVLCIFLCSYQQRAITTLSCVSSSYPITLFLLCQRTNKILLYVGPERQIKARRDDKTRGLTRYLDTCQGYVVCMRITTKNFSRSYHEKKCITRKYQKDRKERGEKKNSLSRWRDVSKIDREILFEVEKDIHKK